MSQVVQHPPEHHHKREGKNQNVHAGEEIGPIVGILKRMRRVGAEESAAIGSQVFDGNDGSYGSPGNVLGFRGAGSLASHGAGLQRARCDGRLERHRHAASHQDDAHQQACRKKHIGHRPPQIDVIVPHVGVAAQPTNDRDEGTKADAGRHEHVEDHEQQLARIREVLLTRVMLQIGVCEKGNCRVENRGRAERALACRREGKDGLQRQDHKAEHEKQRIEQEQRDDVLLPALGTRIQPPLDPLHPSRGVVAAVHNPREVKAARNRQQHRRRNNQKRQEPHCNDLKARLAAVAKRAGFRSRVEPASKSRPVRTSPAQRTTLRA